MPKFSMDKAKKRPSPLPLNKPAEAATAAPVTLPKNKKPTNKKAPAKVTMSLRFTPEEHALIMKKLNRRPAQLILSEHIVEWANK